MKLKYTRKVPLRSERRGQIRSQSKINGLVRSHRTDEVTMQKKESSSDVTEVR